MIVKVCIHKVWLIIKDIGIGASLSDVKHGEVQWNNGWILDRTRPRY
jgi:hypothetical protein